MGMNSIINKTILQHIGKSDLISELQRKLHHQSSELIEIIGDTGSGKTYLFNKLSQQLEEKGTDFKLYYPSVFEINQFSNVFKLIFDLDNKAFEETMKQAIDEQTSFKYDFFFLLTELMRKSNKLHLLILAML